MTLLVEKRKVKRGQSFFSFMSKKDQELCSRNRFSLAFPSLKLRVDGPIVLIEETENEDRVVALVSEIDDYLKDIRHGAASWEEFRGHYTFLESPPMIARSWAYSRKRLRDELAEDLCLSGCDLDSAFEWLTYGVKVMA